MRKLLTATLLFTLLAGSTFASAPKEPKEKKEKPVDTAKEDKKKAKEEEKRLKDEIKAYLKNPESYKSRMENFKTTIDSNEAQLARAKAGLDVAVAKQAEAESKLAAQTDDLKKMSEENDNLKTKVSSGGGGGESLSGASTGTAYKVQLGMYRGFNINKYFEQPKSITYEVVDGMNRYVIGAFPEEQSAKNFVTDIRKLGVKDAFVAKYIDGTRVYEWNDNPKYTGKKAPNSLEDALQNAGGKKKKHKKEEN
ncbi:MAG: hypothetical protein JWO06_3401 [Bacteroidota bacterium]|nr:hypothetical protein [Bacteroidota bacterium]